MDCKRPLPNVPQKNVQCEEGAARYVTVGESGSLITDTSQGQKMDYEERYEDIVYMGMSQPPKSEETKKGRNSRLLLYIIMTIIALILLIFISVVSARLVSLGKIIEEQQHELRQEKERRGTELVEMRTNISRALRDDMNKEKQARQALAEEITQMKAHNSKFFSVAFHAVVFTKFPTINDGEKVQFDTSKLNIGNGYNPTTGVFTVPAGSGGLYFFSTHVVINDGKSAHLQLIKNNEILCGFLEDNRDSANEDGNGSCSATVELNAGDQVHVTYVTGTGTEVLQCDYNQCGFTGFLMKPAN